MKNQRWLRRIDWKIAVSQKKTFATEKFTPYLQKASTYREVCNSFSWRVPRYYNIGIDICDKHVAFGRGDNPAIIFDDRQKVKVFTFNDLMKVSNRMANALIQKLGMRVQDRLAILLPQCPETAISHIAGYKFGGICLPLFTLFGPDALQYRLQNSETKTLVTNMECLEKIIQVKDQLPKLKNIILVSDGEKVPDKIGDIKVFDFWELLEEGSSEFKPVTTESNQPALIIYTSGTTGPPKGCLHAHRVLIGHMPGVEYPQNFFPQEGDCFWTPADWSWIGGLIDVLLPSLSHGIPVVAHRAKKFDPEEAFSLMAKHQVRNAFMPPTALKLMRQVENPAKKYKYKLRSIGSGGESLGEKILEWGRQTFGLTINEFYGQTEANLLVGNCYLVSEIKPGSMGRAIPGHVVEVVNEEGIVLGPNEIGYVGVRPDPVAFLEYLNNPEATAKKFTKNKEWLNTGDLAKKDEDGYFYFVGREDDLINSSGYRMGPTEIEDCLLHHPAVSVCAVIGAPDELRNEIVKAFIVVKDTHTHLLRDNNSAQGLLKDIQQFVKQRLAAHEYPREIEFVESLPMTTTGKIQRNVLKKQEWEKYQQKKK